MPFSLFKEEVAKQFGVPVQFQQFWLWAKRSNHTYRPYQPLTLQEETQSVGQLREVSNKLACNAAHDADLKLFLEIVLVPESHPIPPPGKTKEDILLFFKLYDAEREEIWYVGRLYVKGSGKPLEILKMLNAMAGFSPDEELDFYEEIKFEPSVSCRHVDKKLTFRANLLEDGDIIFFQKPASVDSTILYRYPDVPSFLEYIHNLQVVRFRSLQKPKEDDFCLELSKVSTYDDVTVSVARHLKYQAIEYQSVDHLSEMLIHYNQTSDILYYEVLDIPLPELQGLKTLEVSFCDATKNDTVVHTVRLPKQSTVGDLINDLKTKVELSHPDAELRLLEVFHHKIYKIENINDDHYCMTLRAEEILEEEKNLGPQGRLIHVYHFTFTKNAHAYQTQVQNFGEPFFLAVHEGETLGAAKLRIQKKLQIPDEEFAKWKFAVLSVGRPEYLQDSDIVSSHFQNVYGTWELGLEHSDSSPKREYAGNKNRRTFEKPSKNLHIG